MADSFVHFEETDEFHDFIDSRRLKKKDEVVRIVKHSLDCNEMLLANLLRIVQKNYQILHIFLLSNSYRIFH